MNLDRLVTQADPARSVNIPTGDSAQARWTLAQIAVRHSRLPGRRRVALVMAGVTFVIAGAVAGVVDTTSTTQGSSAVVVLEHAATTAARLPAPAMAPGRTRVIETTSTYEVAVYAPGPSVTKLVRVATAEYRQLDQAWLDAAGTGHALLTRSPLSFSSAADQAAWNASTAGQAFSAQFRSRVVEPDVRNVVADVHGLPLRIDQLTAIITAGTRGTNPDHIPAGPAAVFERTARLLVGPTTGLTPRLSAALYHLLARQGGVRLAGSTTSRQGHHLITVALTGVPGRSDMTVDTTIGSTIVAHYPLLPPTLAEPGAPGRATLTCTSGKGCQTGATTGLHSVSLTVLSPLRIEAHAATATSTTSPA